MSLINTGLKNLQAYTNSIEPQFYISTYYSLTGVPIFIQYKTPDVYNGATKIIRYKTDFGETDVIPLTSNPNEKVFYTYNNSGTFYISYSAYFDNNSVKKYQITVPLIIKKEWEKYNENQLRFANEISLNLPHTLNDIEIQPNEWGVDDIFNTAIYRLQDSIDYLKGNTQTISIDSPSIFFGWLGNNSTSKASGIKWFTQTYNSVYYANPQLATSEGINHFTDIKDSSENNNRIFVLDGTKFRAFSADATPIEINFSNSDDVSRLLKNPVSFDFDDTGKFIYICDSLADKIYKFNLDLEKPALDIQLSLGGYGGFNENDKFNTPTEIYYSNDNVYVLDYNNLSIKQYNKDLNWLYTYTSTVLDNDQPTSIAIHPNTSYIYVLSESYNLYVFDNFTTEPFAQFNLMEPNDGSKLIKITFDENGDFLYILTEQNIYKYSSSLLYITKLQIPKTTDITYKNIKKTTNKSLYISTKNSILKCQDVLEVFSIGEGLPYKFWTRDQLKVSNDELALDLNYNRSLIRMAQNIKSFRSTLNAKFVLIPKQTITSVVNYLTWIPLNSNQLPVFDNDIENETLGVGVNELHVPQVFNKELKKLYNAIDILRNFLNVSNVNIDTINKNLNCNGEFCWSWKAMSCYGLELPIIKTCELNPITFLELMSDFPYTYNANGWSNLWQDAVSDCCRKSNVKTITN
jgi:6-phosphogluconolactonase (cycloisomerase 2 family)